MEGKCIQRVRAKFRSRFPLNTIMKSFVRWLAEEVDNETRKKYRGLDPSSALEGDYGEPSSMTAFIYSSATNTLFCQPGDILHKKGRYGETDLRMVEEEPGNSKFLVGRFGDGWVTVWRTSSTPDSSGPYDVHYGLPLGGEEVLQKMLAGMMGSVRVVGESPARLPISGDYVVTKADGTVEYVRNVVGGGVKEDPCKDLAKIGDMDLGAVLSSLHMVRGAALEKIKFAVCNSYENLKGVLEKNGCSGQLGLLGDARRRVGDCSGYDWRRALSGHRDELRKAFSGDVESEFRGRQRDIDAAWDKLNT